MKLAEIVYANWSLSFSVNIFFIAAVVVLIVFLPKIWLKMKTSLPLSLKEYTISLWGNSVTIKCDYLDREIAFQSWVEMNTRKIGLPLDEENDVIVEVYNSWYAFFGKIRENIKKMPGQKLRSSIDLIETLTNVLNTSLRGHLTKWQARFRRWYNEEIEKEENKSLSPQEIQKKYPEYDNLLADMKKTIEHMIELKGNLYTVAFRDSKRTQQHP